MTFICSLKTFCFFSHSSPAIPTQRRRSGNDEASPPHQTRVPLCRRSQTSSLSQTASHQALLSFLGTPQCAFAVTKIGLIIWACHFRKPWCSRPPHCMVFCGRGRSLKCSWGGQQAPPEKSEKFSTTPRVSCSHHTRPVLRPLYLSFFLFPSRMTSH